MSNVSREQILADFQGVTGLENVEECIQILEQHNWDLTVAAQKVLEGIGGASDNESTVPIQTTTNDLVSIGTKIINQTMGSNKRQSDSDDFDDPDEPRIIKTIPGGQWSERGASSTVTRGPVRDLIFNIEYCDRTEQVTIFDNQTVQQLRLLIAEKLHIPPRQQNFLNWKNKSYDDRTFLRDLHLPKENPIHLATTANGTPDRTQNRTTLTSRTSDADSNDDFPITVVCNDRTGKSTIVNLVLKSNTTISDIKKQIEQTAHIPVRQQAWTGLQGAQDSDGLCHTSIVPRARLIVSQVDIASSNQQTPTVRRANNSTTGTFGRNDDDQMDLDQEIITEHYDDDDVTVLPGVTTTTTTVNRRITGREPLIPDGCTDDTSALEHFTRVFHTRYGSTGLILYIGPLDQAIQDSLYSPIDIRRPLAIYLHNDQSVCANVFCSQVLCAESIVEYLANNYVLWAWDVTSDSNRIRLLESLKRCVGNQCVQRIASMESDTFPLLLIISRSRGSLELIDIIEGKSTPDEVVSNLMQSNDSFEQQRQRDAGEETVREQREELKRQQEAEYSRSLAADQAKELARLDDERRQQEEQKATEQVKQQRLQHQRECQARLPEEPSETEKNITQLKIRLPDGEGVLLRRFRIGDNLQVLFDYLTSQGRVFGEYKLLTTFPKRDLTTSSQSQTFENLKLYPQEQLILESL